MVGEPHFDRIQERLTGLFFKTGFPTVPELRLQIGRIDDGRRISRTRQLVDTLGYLQMIGKGFLVIVTG